MGIARQWLEAADDGLGTMANGGDVSGVGSGADGAFRKVR